MDDEFDEALKEQANVITRAYFQDAGNGLGGMFAHTSINRISYEQYSKMAKLHRVTIELRHNTELHGIVFDECILKRPGRISSVTFAECVIGKNCEFWVDGKKVKDFAEFLEGWNK